MKKLSIIPFILMSLVAIPSWGETMDDLVERDGIYYKKFSDEPFTGKVTGLARGTIKNGKIEGSWKRFYDSGQLNVDGNYVSGVKDGVWVFYEENGQLGAKIEFTNGKRKRIREYWVNGNLRYRGDYKNGKREGLWLFYGWSGDFNKKRSGIYKDGEKISD